jgi:hypothetical protein
MPGAGIMVLDILLIWLALAGLAVLFMYCCSRVSDDDRRDLTVDELITEAFHSRGTASTGSKDRLYPEVRTLLTR